MFPNLGFPEMLIVMVAAVLLFGKRLPEVGRSLGKGIVEFKKGLRGIEEEFESATRPSSSETSSHSELVEVSAPKFEPPTSPPVPGNEYDPQTHHV
jgi:sec-independent protein translocase protein TatA